MRVARAQGSTWTAVLEDRESGERVTVEARGVVNASGPWVGRVRALAGGAQAKQGVRLVKGSHIVVRRLFDHAHPYIFQTGDGRVLFAIPYEEDYTLLGTTDVEFGDAPGRVQITPEEIDYICAAANAYFATPVTPADVVWSYAGIRPLIDDYAENASEVTRDYVLHLDQGSAPMLSVYGGKITTYRRLAEQAVDLLAGPLRANGLRWTADAPLPGGDIRGADIGEFAAQCAARYSWLPEALLRHFVRHYGTEMHVLLAGCSSVDDLGEHFGAGLYAAEVAYLVEHEWARTADDILWRRTRKGLGVSAGGRRATACVPWGERGTASGDSVLALALVSADDHLALDVDRPHGAVVAQHHQREQHVLQALGELVAGSQHRRRARIEDDDIGPATGIERCRSRHRDEGRAHCPGWRGRTRRRR